MISNTTSESNATVRPPFWLRQFAETRTEAQLIFDVVFGAIAPVLCFYFDPVVFKGDLFPGTGLPSYQLFAYGVAAVEVSVFTVWLLFGARLQGWSGLVGGVLICGAIFSTVVGVAILPLSILGLILAIGVLGFIPFITAFVYLRVGWRTFKSEERTSPVFRTFALLMGAILSLGIPAVGNFYVERTASQSMDAVLHGSPQQAQVGLTRLRRLPLIPRQDLESLVEAYTIEKDPSRKETLKNSYRQITGDDIDTRLAMFND